MSRKVKKVLGVILAVLMMASLLAGCGKTAQTPQQTQPAVTQGGGKAPSEPAETTVPGRNPPEVTAPEDEPYTEPPTEPPVQVVMPEYQLTYSGDMSEKIIYEELTEEVGLRFYVRLSSGQVPLFTLLIGDTKGDFVEMKENGAGEQIPVSFLMDGAPENISDEDKRAFLMAQDLANEIVASLILK